jgi:Tol biopolymer transport system component
VRFRRMRRCSNAQRLSSLERLIVADNDRRVSLGGEKLMTADRLDSWKEIAAYLKRSVRTVTRWEREEGLPVHRHVHSKSGTVYAFKPELDTWWSSRGKQLDTQHAILEPRAATGTRNRWIAAGVVSAALALSALWLATGRRPVSSVPTSIPLTTLPGIEGPPSLSPDGSQVTFERGGDIFVKQVDGEALVQLTNTPALESAPAWSPDGRLIAFRRADNSLFVISPLGGGERQVGATDTPLLLKSMAWTPDGSALVFSELTSPICASLFAMSVATGEKRRLTQPPEPSIGDGWPAVSPDGRLVAFARYSQDTAANIHVVPLTGGEPRQLTTDKASLFGIAWSSDDELVFSSDRDGTSRLWRVSSRSSSNPIVSRLDAAGEDARFPAVSHPGPRAPVRLAYQRFVQNLDIRRAELVGDATPQPALRPSKSFIASTRSEDHPRYSPDGSRIAFVSRRSGTHEIWVSNSDGMDPVRLTSMGGPILVGPQWSPDGSRIAFFGATGLAGTYAVYVMSAHGGQLTRLTRNETELEALPAWASDGTFLYVASGRSGSLQIWKKPLDGSPPAQLTRSGGAESAVSPDGQTLYFAKVPEMGPGLWALSVNGGEEIRVLASPRFGYWAMSRSGIYFADFEVARELPRPVKFFSFQSRQITQVGTVENTVWWTNTPGFTISPDGRWLLYSSLESTDADLMLVDNFR